MIVLLLLFIFKLHGLADFAEMNYAVLGVEGCTADVTAVV